MQLVIYTTTGAPAFSDEKAIRRSAVTYRVPCITTMSGARAAAEAVARASATPSASGACRRFTAPMERAFVLALARLRRPARCCRNCCGLSARNGQRLPVRVLEMLGEKDDLAAMIGVMSQPAG